MDLKKSDMNAPINTIIIIIIYHNNNQSIFIWRKSITHAPHTLTQIYYNNKIVLFYGTVLHSVVLYGCNDLDLPPMAGWRQRGR